MIREGEIKKYLVQPVDLIGFLLLTRVAHKLVYYVMAAIPFALVFYLLRDHLPPWPGALILSAYLASLVMGFFIGFFMETAIGLVTFWWLEVKSVLFVYMLFTYLLSGHMFPLDMLPEPYFSMVKALPMQYLAYFPSAVFLGKVQGQALAQGLLIQLTWVVFFVILSRFLYARGVKQYSGYGG